MLRFFKIKNKKTGSRHYIQSIQNQIKLFHQLEILQKKENISKNSTRVTGLQLIKKDNLDVINFSNEISQGLISTFNGTFPDIKSRFVNFYNSLIED